MSRNLQDAGEEAVHKAREVEDKIDTFRENITMLQADAKILFENHGELLDAAKMVEDTIYGLEDETLSKDRTKLTDCEKLLKTLYKHRDKLEDLFLETSRRLEEANREISIKHL